MPLFRASCHIPAPPERVWAALLDWEGSERWMVPPTTVEIVGTQREGIGTRLRAVSTFARAIPLVDHMVVTNWIEGREIRVRHVGWPVRGDGIFRVAPEGDGARFDWIEDFALPFAFVGEVAGYLLRPIAEWFLRRSCARLAAEVTGAA